MNEFIVKLIFAFVGVGIGYISACALENRKTKRGLRNLREILRAELNGNLTLLKNGKRFQSESRHTDAHFYMISCAAYEGCIAQIGGLEKSEVKAVAEAYMKIRPLKVKDEIKGKVNEDKIFQEALDSTRNAVSKLK